MLFEIEVDYLPLRKAARGDIKSWEIARGLVTEHHLHRQCRAALALPSEGTTRRSVKTNESHGVIRVGVIAHTGARTLEIPVSLVDLVEPCHGSEGWVGDKSKRIYCSSMDSGNGGLDRRRIYGKVKVEHAEHRMQGRNFTKCQAFEALGILLELRNCYETVLLRYVRYAYTVPGPSYR